MAYLWFSYYQIKDRRSPQALSFSTAFPPYLLLVGFDRKSFMWSLCKVAFAHALFELNCGLFIVLPPLSPFIAFKKFKMSFKSFVQNCGNATLPNKVALFRFPAEETLKLVWVDFVSVEHFQTKYTSKARICSNHFVPQCFANLDQWQNGFASMLNLLPNAIPSVLPVPSASSTNSKPQIPSADPGSLWEEIGKKGAWKCDGVLEVSTLSLVFFLIW